MKTKLFIVGVVLAVAIALLTLYATVGSTAIQVTGDNVINGLRTVATMTAPQPTATPVHVK